MLSARKISKAYDHPVLTDFTYQFPEKGLILIRGASGCGKTTLLRILAGLESPDNGTLTDREKAKVSCVFQEPHLVPHLSVLSNVLLVKKTKDKARAMQLLSELGLEAEADKFPDELSGGMKLRVAIARSLYYGGELYLWDEPTKELDPENRAKVERIIAKLSQQACVVAVTHDPQLTSENEIRF